MAQYTEGQLLTGSDGRPYVVRNGVPVVDMPAGRGVLLNAPVKPGAQYAEAQAAAELAATRARAAAATAVLPTAPAQAQAELAKAQAQAQSAQIEAREAAAKNGNKPDPQQARIAQQMATDDVLGAISHARELVNGGGTTGMGSLLSGIPGTSAKDLDSTLSQIKSAITLGKLAELKSSSAQGASGLGALSDSEGRLLANSIASIDQGQSTQQMLANLAKIEKHYRNGSALLNGEDPRKDEVQQKYGLAALPSKAGAAGSIGGGGGGSGGSDGGAGGAPLAPASGGFRTEADPAMAGVNAHVRSMLGSGRSADQIAAYLDQVQPGLGGQMRGSVSDATAFRAQNPNVPLSSYPIDVEQRSVPMSATRQAVNTMAQSPLGTYGMAAADAATAGFLPSFTGNPALARAGMDAAANRNPGSSLLGTITGGALAAGGLEAGAGALPFLARGGVGAARAADAAYGGLYGASQSDASVGGVAAGALAGVAGGMFGRGLARTGGRALAGVQDKALTTLRDAGVPLSIGQALGGSAKALEDRLTSVPIVGGAINARRGEGLKAFNRAAFDEALGPIGGSTNGAIGDQGVAAALRQVGSAYDSALGGVSVNVDSPYRSAMGQLQAQIPKIPRVGRELAAGLQETVAPMFNGTQLAGQSMQAIDRGLQQLKSGYKNDPLFATHIAPAVDAVGSEVRGMFGRQAPQVIPAYDAAKAAYRNTSVLADSDLRALNNGGEFTPAQLGMVSRQNAVKFGGRNAAASGNRPFADLQAAAQEVLPSKYPDSGTAGRLMLAGVGSGLGGALGALTGHGESGEGENHRDSTRGSNAAMGALALGGLAAIPYSRPVQGLVTQGLLAERPQSVQALGRALLARQRYGGMFGAPLALTQGPLALQQQPAF